MTRPGSDDGRGLRDRASTQQARGTKTELCPECRTAVGLNAGSVVRHRSPHTDHWCAGLGRVPLSARHQEPVPGEDEVSARRRGDWVRRVILPRAVAFITAVREQHRLALGEHLAGYSRVELEALAVTLAAMVPEDRSASELLGWISFGDDGRPMAARTGVAA